MENNLTGKQILLLYAKFFNYDKIVYNKLKELGAKVDLYDARAELSSYEKAFLKIYKVFFYKKLSIYHHGIIEAQKDCQYDYIFTNSYLPEDTINEYKQNFPNAIFILYMDDSVNNTPNIEKTFRLYDSVKTFDRSDSLKYNIKLQPLFFEDSYADINTNIRFSYDVCFIGTVHSDRLKIILEIDRVCREKGLKFYHYCYLQSRFIYYFYYLTKKEFRLVPKSFFRFKQIPTSEIAIIFSLSQAILDIQHPLQTGLTMRTIETIGAGKKLITTNHDIKNYDIYNENNICLIDRTSSSVEDGFLKSTYIPLDKDLRYKYSLEGWIYSIFN